MYIFNSTYHQQIKQDRLEFINELDERSCCFNDCINKEYYSSFGIFAIIKLALSKEIKIHETINTKLLNIDCILNALANIKISLVAEYKKICIQYKGRAINKHISDLLMMLIEDQYLLDKYNYDLEDNYVVELLKIYKFKQPEDVYNKRLTNIEALKEVVNNRAKHLYNIYAAILRLSETDIISAKVLKAYLMQTEFIVYKVIFNTLEDSVNGYHFIIDINLWYKIDILISTILDSIGLVALSYIKQVDYNKIKLTEYTVNMHEINTSIARSMMIFKIALLTSISILCIYLANVRLKSQAQNNKKLIY